MKNRKFENLQLHRLAVALGKNKDYKTAYETLTISNTLKDSIQNEDNLAAISELEIKYQTEKKEQEIQLLNEKAARKDLQNTVLIGGLLSLLAIIMAMFYAFKQRVKLNKFTKEKLEQELAFSQKELNIKKQELTAYALQLANKNEMLQNIKSRVEEIKSEEHKNKALQSISNSIHLNQNDDASWEGFRERFQAVHKDFDTKVLNTFPEITKNDLRLMALIRMSLSSKEIANILNISPEGVKKARYRLRKKLQLESSDSLEDFIIGF